MAATSKTEMNFDGTKISTEYERGIYSSPNVPDGEVYLLEDQTYYYDAEEPEDAIGEDFSLKVTNEQDSEETLQALNEKASRRLR